jgi:hypothetical protein
MKVLPFDSLHALSVKLTRQIEAADKRGDQQEVNKLIRRKMAVLRVQARHTKFVKESL